MAFSQFMQGNKPTQRKKNIFISYREKDTAGETGRLADSLLQYFEADQVFRDIDKIEPGIDFSDAISKSLEACDVMLAVIGPDWATITHPNSTDPRLKDPNDWVRIEIASALSRNIRVVPVLVNGAVLPTSNQLPHDLQGLLRRQSYEVSNRRWQYDTENLAAFLEKSVGIPQKNKQGVNQVPQKAPGGIIGFVKMGLIGIGALFLVLVIYYAGQNEQTEPPENVDPPYINSPVTVDNNNIHPEPNEPEKKLPDQLPEAISAVDLEGFWDDANGLYYFDIFQNGNQVEVYSYATLNNQKTGEGLGVINGKKFTFKINVLNFGFISADTKLAPNGKSLSGTLTIQNNGASYNEPLTLNRRSE